MPIFAGGDQPNLPEEHEHETVVETEKIEIVKFVEVNGEIQPRSFECPYCNAEIQYHSAMVGEWETVSFTSCQYGYMNHTDKVQERVTTIKYKCTNSNCGVIDTEYFTETRQICQ